MKEKFTIDLATCDKMQFKSAIVDMMEGYHRCQELEFKITPIKGFTHTQALTYLREFIEEVQMPDKSFED